MAEMVVLAQEPREVGSQRIDELLEILFAAALLEIVDIGIEARQPQRPETFASRDTTSVRLASDREIPASA